MVHLIFIQQNLYIYRMKFISNLVCLSLFLFASCSQNLRESGSQEIAVEDSSKISQEQVSKQSLVTKMAILSPMNSVDSVMLKFTVYNYSDSAKTFCIWHTPFEPLMSKYLDITDRNGEEAPYTGPMAKRIMPPPASSYITLAAQDSLTALVNLSEAYSIKKSSTYRLRYNANEISGLSVSDSIEFTVGD